MTAARPANTAIRPAALQVLSHYSFLRGASSPAELVQRAQEQGLGAIAITDDCSLAGAPQMHFAAKAAGIKLLVGARFDVQRSRPMPLRPAPDERLPGLDQGLDLAAAAADPGPLFRLILLATDLEAYGNLSQFITDLRLTAPKGSYRLSWREVQPQHLGGLLAIALPGRRTPDAELLGIGRWLLKHFPARAWIGVDLHQQLDDARWLQRLRWLQAQTALPLVAAPQRLMHRAQRKPLQDLMTAIRLRRPLQDCGFALAPNADAHLQALGPPYEPAWIAETALIAERCRFSLDEIRYQYPDEVVPPGRTAIGHLTRLTVQGMRRRWGQALKPAVRAQLINELRLIRELGYEHYFLTVADIVAFARSRDILCQGRGSAANSAVCFALGVTEVDPARGGLLFERFISRERKEPPDIDVDFEHQRREEVMQYLYAKYGRRRAGLTAVVTRYRPRSALRDAGKALGVAPEQIEALAKEHSHWDAQLQPFGTPDRRLALLARLADELLETPRHLSQHVGGFVLTKGQLSRLVPVENAAMADRSVIQWEKTDLEALGLMKVDVLALGMLSCLRRARDLMRTHRGRPDWALQDIPAEDESTYKMLQQADSVGVFQVESRAQMAMLPRLRPERFYDLVVQVAIVRPGPIQGGMVHPYLKRRQGLEKVDYESDALRPALERTLGVPIFQEQVMQVAMIAAGFTPGEADQLRRGMAAWTRRGDLSPFHQKLLQGMRARGYSQEFADRIYAQIQGFAEYGFPESHAASFALLTYQSSWLKCHEPAIFLTALLNSQPLGFYTPSQLVQDAVRHGVEVRPPCVNSSHWETRLEADAVRLGLHLVKGLKQASAERIAAQAAAAPFASVEDLQRRARLERLDLQQLAAADALRALSGQRRQQLWDAAALHRLPSLLEEARFDEPTLALPAAPEGEEVLWDYQSLGLSLRSHPLALLRGKLRSAGYADSAALQTLPDRRLARFCGLVTVRQRPGTASGVTFLSLEDEHGTVQAVVWTRVYERFRAAVRHARLLGVWGQWQVESGVRNLIAHRLVDHSDWLGELPMKSRDFH